MEEQILLQLFGTKDLDQIDLQTTEYQDHDEQIYYIERELIESLNKLEEDNLFNINLRQSEEEQLEVMRKESNARIAEMRRKLLEQEENIKAKEETKSLMQQKHQFFLNNQSQGKEKKLTQRTSFNLPEQKPFEKYLNEIGATSAESTTILTKLTAMLSMLGMSDKSENLVEAMRKFEIKFWQLYEVKNKAFNESTEYRNCMI